MQFILPRHNDSRQHFLLIQSSAAENLVQSTVFPLLDLDLPPQFFTALERGFLFVKLFSGAHNLIFCFLQQLLQQGRSKGALSTDGSGYLIPQVLPIPFLLCQMPLRLLVRIPPLLKRDLIFVFQNRLRRQLLQLLQQARDTVLTAASTRSAW